LQLLIRSLELLGPDAHTLFQIFQSDLGLLQQTPFLCQGVGQLLHFDVVEWLLEDDQAIGMAQFFHHVVPGIVRMGRADDHLQVWIDFPQFGSGLDPVPARSHPHVHESQGVGLTRLHRFLEQAQSVLALKRRVDVEDLAAGRRRRLVEQEGFALLQFLMTDLICAENLVKILMDRPIVVDHQYALAALKV
jgi:hypothetical protein